MPKSDLRGSLQAQVKAQRSSSSSGQGTLIEDPEAITDAEGNMLAYVNASNSSSQSLLAGKFAYDPDEIVWVDAKKVHDSPWQYRAGDYTDVAQLQDLIDSFNERGQLQPYPARPHPDQRLHPGEYQQGCGHRRKYTVLIGGANAGTGRPDAANLIGKVPILIRNISDSDMASIALDENETQAKVKPLDRARGYLNLQLAVSNEMADEGLIKRLPNGQLAKLASWRQVEARKGKHFRTLARVASLLQLPKDIIAEFDAPGNWGFLTVTHGLGLLTLQDYPQDQKRLLHDAIEKGWSGDEVTIQADERLKSIKERLGQGVLEGTGDAAKTPAKPKQDAGGGKPGAKSSAASPSDGAGSESSAGASESGDGPKLSLVPGGSSSETITPSDVLIIHPDGTGSWGSSGSANDGEQATLGNDVEPISHNEALIRKARSFIDAAFNELEQCTESEEFDIKEIRWAQRCLGNSLNSLRLAKNEG